MNQTVEPIIPSHKTAPEITFRVIVLAIILTLALTAANAFLGLKVGSTVSASIPAAVISLSILRFFKNSSVLESTMVQTSASVGEGLVAGMAFVLPALLVLGFWHHFNYIQTAIIGLVGGTLGVLFTIPIRRALLDSPELRFPEGTAIGKVLQASASDEQADFKMLVNGGIIGALISLFQTGFQVVAENLEYWCRLGQSLFGIGAGFSPALIAAGYIVGINVGFSMFVGVVIGWIVGVPIISHHYGFDNSLSYMDAAGTLWNNYIRYLGVGTMLVGGLWTLIRLFTPVAHSLATSWKSMRAAKHSKKAVQIPRTERDIPLNSVIWLLGLLVIPMFLFIWYNMNPNILPISSGLRLAATIISVVYVIIVGFAFSSIAAYFAGLIGSTNCPGSGLTISMLLVLSLILLALFSVDIDFIGKVSAHELAAASVALLITAILSAANIIANETMQDLKVGQIVGATPWKQQVMLILGVVIAALIIPPILELLFNAYGMAGVFPRPGMNPNQMLAAPQAGLMAAIAKGTFAHNLPWTMIIIGGIIGIVCIIIDEILRIRGLMRLPVLAVGLGIYLPFGASIPVFFGGILHAFTERSLKKLRMNAPRNSEIERVITIRKHRGLTMACGVVAGSALMGVLLAIPFSIKQSSDALRLVGDGFTPIASFLGVAVTAALCIWMFWAICKKRVD